jgi:general secretion pathway protein D
MHPQSQKTAASCHSQKSPQGQRKGFCDHPLQTLDATDSANMLANNKECQRFAGLNDQGNAAASGTSLAPRHGMRIKPFALAFSLVSFFGASAARATSLPIVDVIPGSQSVNLGSPFSIDVKIIGIEDLYGFQFDLSFDATILQATTITEGGILPVGGPTFFLPGFIDNIAGSITFTADTLTGPIVGVTGDGVLAEFGFTSITTGSSSLTVSNVLLLDSNGSILDAQTVSGSATVNRGSDEPTPVPEPASGILLLSGVAASCRAWRARTRR